MKTCPPCHQDCEQGRRCPARMRLRDLAVGEAFTLVRGNKRYVLERIQRTPGLGPKYYCRDESAGLIQLHHSVYVTRVEQPPPPGDE